MAKCILISYAGYPYTLSSLLPDNGLANLAGALLQAGHKVKILDFGTVTIIKRLIPEGHHTALNKTFQKYGNTIYQQGLKEFNRINKNLENYQKEEVKKIGAEIAEFIRSEKADFAGFKLWNGDGFTGSIAIAEEVKKRLPKIPLIAGGPHVDMYRELIFQETNIFDILAYGEGEEAITHIAELYSNSNGKNVIKYAHLKNISNIIFKHKNKVIINSSKWIKDLNTLPYPCYAKNVYLSMNGDEKIKIIVLDESRGCSNSCYFCMQPIKSGSITRMKTSERIIREIKMIIREQGINCFRFAGSGTPTRLIKKVAEGLIQQDIKIKYTMFARINDASEGIYKLLQKSGCCGIFFGVESGSQVILDKSLGKKVKVEKIKKIVKACKKSGIFTVASFIIPAPFETEKTMKESYDLIDETKPDSILVLPPGILNGTVWEKHYKEFNFELSSKKDYFKKLMKYKYKLFFPIQLWDPLPIKINNKSYHEFTSQTSDFIMTLEANGILTFFLDELKIVADYCGYAKKEKKFRDWVRMLHLQGDYKQIGEIVKKVNQKILN